ncbi:glycoside hydrolase family 2 protein [Niabella drilacis]|uniref:beta-galactosidase n=1 Tax=Niabella drilacis (strain DSM 25811 / CCM 8410 / CCUG 62505 / LMG 26954 / E90) TaxID=1285928 RepID=A0A1G7A501_NIADE|nr:glycoside hydrolase family 2 TIM barrel-domain containing protein [Niabella drilacis]SDE09964.1 Glycosyl hydrolases family 2 [Niabella drilacis]
MKRIVFLCTLSIATTLFAADSTMTVNRWTVMPVQVSGLQRFVLDLDGTWLFNPAPEPGFEAQPRESNNWKKIQVPGEWVMQGFKVEKNEWAGYRRSFSIPGNWAGNRFKLRCDAVYSQCDIFINGKKAGSHLGGFTPFEIDITSYVQPGAEAVIAIKVKNESPADAAASASMYAVHPLGGISRKIRVVAVPELNISNFHAATLFDKDYNNARLQTEIELSNEGRAAATDVVLLFELLSNNTVILTKKITVGQTITAGKTIKHQFEVEVEKPLKWDPEHPRLYTWRVRMEAGNRGETVQRRIGFRQVEVRGNQVFVNNYPIKLRGVCRHEIMPLRGRSLVAGQWEEDVRIFRDANVNYIRTSHYPPPEELIAACDSLGMFVEAEAPFCWAHRDYNATKADSVAVLQSQTLDMINQFRSQPSVIIWSVGNESLKYKEYFSQTAELVKVLDPTRPRNFSQWAPDADGGALEIGNHHYPGPAGPDMYANAKRPVVFDEYVHINAYNRLELAADPGVRDDWGIGFAQMWDRMYDAKGVLGGAIWGGIDDTFVLGDTTAVGYGTWGIIDGWRRQKPEYWHTKKAYSPVRIEQRSNWKNGQVILHIRNRHCFSNLSECRIQWQAGSASGVLRPDIKPGESSDVAILCPQPDAGATLKITVYDPRNVLVDEYRFKNIVPEIVPPAQQIKEVLKWNYQKSNTGVVARSKEWELRLDRVNNRLQVYRQGKPVLDSLADLLLLPYNEAGDGVQMLGKRYYYPAYTPVCANRIIQQYACDEGETVFSVTVWDGYNEADGYTIYHFEAGGTAQITYAYEIKEDVNPRQWGLVLHLAPSFHTLSWQRRGLWNAYPEDHIGRLDGRAEALNTNRISGAAGPLWKPANDWLLDRNEWGSNDFRSTKMNILNASLSDKSNTLQVVSDGRQHSRSWIEGNAVHWLVAEYSGLGSEGFFKDHRKQFEKPLKKGTVISGTINLTLKQVRK